MFSIDLLKGKGLPQKGSPKRVVFRTVPFLIPIMAVMAWAAGYQRDCSRTADYKVRLRENRSVIEAAGKEIKAYEQINADTAAIKRCLDDLTAALKYRVQVSDLLVEFVENLPDEILIYEMQLDRNAILEKFQNPETNALEPRLMILRGLNLTLCGFDTEKSDQSVQDYVEKLKASPVLAPVFDEIKPTAQQRGEVDRQAATYYEIECTLHTQG